MKFTYSSRKIRHAAAILGFLGAAWLSTAAQEKTAFSERPDILPFPPRSEERVALIESFKKMAPNLMKQFAPFTHTNAQAEVMPYRLFTPQNIEPGRKYPLVVFLHGASSSGTDNEKQLQGGSMFGGLVWAVPENQKRFPCFVVAPQTNVNWPCVILEPGKRPQLCPGLGMGARLALEIIDKLITEQPIDSKRIYVTGHSMGGAGTWHMIAHRPRFFAAAVPVCGLPDFSTAPAVKDIPIWNFHGETDNIEPVTTSRRMIGEIAKAGGWPQYTEYPGVGHNVFMWAYTEPSLVEWLFAQHR
jgi:predicted peptidase